MFRYVLSHFFLYLNVFFKITSSLLNAKIFYLSMGVMLQGICLMIALEIIVAFLLNLKHLATCTSIIVT